MECLMRVTLFTAVAASSFLFPACSGGGSDDSSSAAADRNCSDFSCQQDAQAWHNAHPEDGLDADHDGIACEHLPNCAILAGLYVGVAPQTGEHFDLLLEVTPSHQAVHDPSPVSGLALWGRGRQPAGTITAGFRAGNSIWLTVVPVGNTPYASGAEIEHNAFGVYVDVRLGMGMILGAGSVCADPPSASEFVIISTPRLQ
jgi:hypothetical protein